MTLSGLRRPLQRLEQDGSARQFVILKRIPSDGEQQQGWRAPPMAMATHPWIGFEVPVTVWTSNDYLSLSRHPSVVRAAVDCAKSHGVGSGGTRYLGGTTTLHVDLEQRLAQLHGKQAALLFPSGYAANAAFLEVLLKGMATWTGDGCRPVTVFSDQMNHASLVDGMRRARCAGHVKAVRVLPHLTSPSPSPSQDRHDGDDSRHGDPALFVFESVYSMSGAHAPMRQLMTAAAAANCVTYVDEVHAVGLYGANGEGLAAGCDPAPDLIQGTLGKAFGAAGGYVAGPREAIEYARAFASPFIFSTTLPPPVVAAALAAVNVCASAEGQRLRDRQQHLVHQLHEKLNGAGIPCHRAASNSHILTVPIAELLSRRRSSSSSSSSSAPPPSWSNVQQLTVHLLRQGVYVQAVNYPTVARGQELFRLCPTPSHSSQSIDQLVSSFQTFL